MSKNPLIFPHTQSWSKPFKKVSFYSNDFYHNIIVDKMIDVLSIGKALGQQSPRINFQTLNEEVSPSHFTFKTSKTSFNKDQPQFNETEKN